MNIGNKIKHLRTELGLTQQQLSGDKITRNMLSCIESGKALPSLETLLYIAERLSVPPSYLLSDDNNLFFYQKNKFIKQIKDEYKKRNFENCIKQIEKLSNIDDELAYILANCYFELGKAAVLSGKIISAKEYFLNFDKFSKKCIYDTSLLELKKEMYYSVAENIQSPLLELDTDKYNDALTETTEIEFFKYLIQDNTYNYKNESYISHLRAKELIKSYRYNEAVVKLKSIENNKNKDNYNAYLTLSVYSDLETCYKNIMNFENAYRYCNKRLSLLEGFKS